MNTASKQTLHTIEQIVKPIPIGTNLGLLHLIWAMMIGAFLESRGAVHSALQIAGFTDDETRCSWQALRYGVWHIQELIDRLNQQVLAEGTWQPCEYAGYYPLAVDTTAIWRPRLQNWFLKLYRQLMSKAFVGIGFGLVVRVGEMDGNRIPILCRIVSGAATDKSDENLKRQSLKAAAAVAEDHDVIVHDGGAEISDMHHANVEKFVVRLATNCTGRENELPAYKGRGPYPTKGKIVRPLERKFKEKTLSATPEDVRIEFDFEGVTVIARGWFNLVRSDVKVSAKNNLFSIWVIDDPYFEDVIVLGTNLPNETDPKIIYQLYIDRWPVEQVPLVAKQLLGCHRQFVFHPVSCVRLGQLAFLVGNLLTWLALTMPAFPTGYWDRYPKKRLDDLDGSWRSRIIQKSSSQRGEFARRSRLRNICPKELWLIDGLRMANSIFEPLVV